MEDTQFSFKLLEDVHLKATYDMVVNGRTIVPGETIALFDKISLANFSEVRDMVAARGGYLNEARVYWDTTREINFTFTQGVFSRTQFSLLNNAKMLNISDQIISLTAYEKTESDYYGVVPTKHVPHDNIFIYDAATGEKLSYTKDGNFLVIPQRYVSVVITYRYLYEGGMQVATFGQRAINGFLSLEGKTRVKDDTSGQITTGIIKIPKLKLMSGLSIQLGTQANPVVGKFSAVGVPVDSDYGKYAMEIEFLNNDIDSDM